MHGGGTLQGASNAPLRYDVALSTKKLTALYDYDARDLTVGAGAGMTLAALARTLAEHGQFLPLDAPLASQATLGGTLAAGWAGPRRAAYGRPRDLLIGATLALADGTLAKTGGMVVKNVTGYDMGKLYVGSHGTLGVIVRANFKVLPAPQTRRLAIAPFDEDERERALAHAGALVLEPAALLVVDGFREALGTTRPRLIALLEGSEHVVDRATRELRSALGAAGVAETRLLDGDDALRAFQAVLDAYVARDGDASVTLLSRGLPSDAGARAQRVRAAIPGAETIADLRTGDVVVRVREIMRVERGQRIGERHRSDGSRSPRTRDRAGRRPRRARRRVGRSAVDAGDDARAQDGVRSARHPRAGTVRRCDLSIPSCRASPRCSSATCGARWRSCSAGPAASGVFSRSARAAGSRRRASSAA